MRQSHLDRQGAIMNLTRKRRPAGNSKVLIDTVITERIETKADVNNHPNDGMSHCLLAKRMAVERMSLVRDEAVEN